MADLNAGIILGAQQPNMLAILDASNQAAQSQIQNQNQNALTQYIRQNGAGIMAGDRNALAGYAAFDPQNALAIQGEQEQMSMRREEFAMRKAEVARQTAAELEAKQGQLDAAALEQERAQLERALTGAGSFYQRGDKAGYNNFLSQMGLDPAQFPFENFEATAAQYEGVLEGIAKWQKAFMPKESGQTINVNTGDMGGGPEIGTIPQGYAAVPDPNSPAGYTMMPIPGGPEDMSAKNATAAATAANAASIVLEDIGRAKKLVEGQSWYNPVTGVTGAAAGKVAGSAASDFAALANTIGANISFDKLQKMREASPTGGALGAVTERELALLEATLGSISTSQSQEQLLENLTRLEQQYSEIMRKFDAYPGAQGAAQQPAQPTQQGGPTRKRYNPATGAFE